MLKIGGGTFISGAEMDAYLNGAELPQPKSPCNDSTALEEEALELLARFRTHRRTQSQCCGSVEQRACSDP